METDAVRTVGTARLVTGSVSDPCFVDLAHIVFGGRDGVGDGAVLSFDIAPCLVWDRDQHRRAVHGRVRCKSTGMEFIGKGVFWMVSV